MTPREKFIKALRREPITGHVPHFELVFYLTMEAFGKLHPDQRKYHQWNQMSHTERKLHIEDMAQLYIDTAERYHHSAIFCHPNPGDFDSTVALLECIREKSGDKYFLMLHGDPTYSMPNGNDMMEFTARLYEDGDSLKEHAQKRTEGSLAHALRLRAAGEGLVDGFALCSDYCFNTQPFFSPALFEEFIVPYLKQVTTGYHELGYYVIKHTDGNINPIAAQMVDCGPDALHSLDPQGGVNFAEIRRLYGDRVSLIGNVNCGLLQTGTQEQCEENIRQTLRTGLEAPGFIFSTSNCVYTGLPLERYELMHRIWREEGIYR